MRITVSKLILLSFFLSAVPVFAQSQLPPGQALEYAINACSMGKVDTGSGNLEGGLSLLKKGIKVEGNYSAETYHSILERVDDEAIKVELSKMYYDCLIPMLDRFMSFGTASVQEQQSFSQKDLLQVFSSLEDLFTMKKRAKDEYKSLYGRERIKQQNLRPYNNDVIDAYPYYEKVEEILNKNSYTFLLDGTGDTFDPEKLTEGNIRTLCNVLFPDVEEYNNYVKSIPGEFYRYLHDFQPFEIVTATNLTCAEAGLEESSY